MDVGNVIISLATLVASTGTAIAVVVAAVSSARAAREAAAHTAEVKSDLQKTATATDIKLDSMAKVGIATHKLTNSAMQLMLQKDLLKSQRIAELTNDPADSLEADVAKKALEAHVEKQRQLDAIMTPAEAKGDTVQPAKGE